MKVSIADAALAYENHAPETRRRALAAIGLDATTRRFSDETTAAGVAFFAIGYDEATRPRTPPGEKHVSPLGYLMQALAAGALGAELPPGEELITHPPDQAVSTVANAATAFARLDSAGRTRALEAAGRQGLAWLRPGPIHAAARVFYDTGLSAPRDGALKLMELRKAMTGSTAAASRAGAGSAAFAAPAGATVDPDRLALHERATARATRDGIGYLDAVALEQAPAAGGRAAASRTTAGSPLFAAPRHATIDPDQLALHERAMARAARDGIGYVDAVALEEMSPAARVDAPPMARAGGIAGGG